MQDLEYYYRSLSREYKEAVLSMLHRKFQHQLSDAEETAHHAIYKVSKKLAQSAFVGNIRAYLMRAAHNCALDEIKENPKHHLLEEIQDIPDDPFSEDDDFISEKLNLEPGASNEEKCAEILRRLKEPCRSIVKLFYLPGKSMTEVAEALNMTYDSAKSKKHQCIKQLAKELNLN